MKKFEAEAVIHYGPDKEKALREFAEKWAAVMFDRLKNATLPDLKLLERDVRKELDILESAKLTA